MTDVQGYEGWTNRETWCANLWLANDEGLYRQVVDMAEQAVDEAIEDSGGQAKADATYDLAKQLDAFYGDLTDMAFSRGDWEGCKPTDELVTMIEDIGSAWRIDWYEIAEGWVTDVLNELAVDRKADA